MKIEFPGGLAAVMRRKGLLVSIILVAVALPVGFVAYYQPVRVENLNRQRWCMCGPREVQFKGSSITLIATPHPENEKPGTVIGTYRMENGILMISGIATAGEYALDHLGAHWKPVPGGETNMGGEFYDGRSWKPLVAFLPKKVWRGTKDFFLQDLRKDTGSQVCTAVIVTFVCSLWYWKRRARRRREQEAG